MSAMDMDMVLGQKFFAEINQPPFKIATDIVRHPISVQKTNNPIGFWWYGNAQDCKDLRTT